MATITHTPGPWRCVGHRQIATTQGAWLPICEVWSGGVGIEQADANERLIAAAPELLEALEIAVAALWPYSDEAKQARATIAKATGEQ